MDTEFDSTKEDLSTGASKAQRGTDMDLECQDINENHQNVIDDGAVDASVPRNDIVPEDYSNDALKIYYANLFPFAQLEQWLRYGNDPSSKRNDIDKTFFAKRELSFTLDNDIYLRNQFSLDWKELKTKIAKYTPQKIDIGAVYFSSPKSSNFGFNDDDGNSSQIPMQREFVIDIDMDDYNNVRTCCQETKICTKCWKFMQEGCTVIDRALRDDFGFKHIIWLFSGRRGIHAWVCDQRARLMTNEQRGSVAEYLRIVSGNDKSGIQVDNMHYPLHPHIKRSYSILKKRFYEVIVQDQGLFYLPDITNQVFELVKDKLAKDDNALKNLKIILKNAPSMSPDRFYKDFEAEIEGLTAVEIEDARKKRKHSYSFLMETIVLYFMYPRIDINVSKGMNHLLKSPFCVHPKSKKVSVPILDFRSFDPEEAPKISELVVMREDGTLIPNEAPLRPYIDFFQDFIDQIEESTKKIQQSERDELRKEKARTLEY